MANVTWINPPDGEIDWAHPDYEYWQEAAQMPWPEDLDAAEIDPQPVPQAATPAMPRAAKDVAVPFRLALSREEAAAALSMSVDTFDRRVVPKIKVNSLGRRILIPVRELERWMEENSAFALKGR